MRKGFGFYSSHETTIFLLKAILLSFWIGVDLLGLLAVSALPHSVLAQHRLLVMSVLALLCTGTVFSAMFVWATGSLFGRSPEQAGRRLASRACNILKRKPYHLLGAGLLISVCLNLLSLRGLVSLQEGKEAIMQVTRANTGIAKKCSEIARLERWLFQAEEDVIMAQCLLQYDHSYAGLRKVSMNQQQ